MALSTYTDLKTAVASWCNRTDLTSVIPDCIALAEADMQRHFKLLEFEATATVTITSGVGTLPADFDGMRSVYWDGAVDYPLTYVAPGEFDDWRQQTSGDGEVYTISGNTIRTAPMGSGSAVMTYNAKFTALSAGSPSNSLLANHPDAYLYGTLKQVAIYLKDGAGAGNYGTLFEQAVAGVRVNDDERRWAGPIAVRAG